MLVDLTEEEGRRQLVDLPLDLLQHCFSFLPDGFSLAAQALVSKSWREAVAADHLWGIAVSNRWKLENRKAGKYKYGERSWREVYRVFHRRNKPPRCPGVLHNREVVYASGSASRIGCWMVLNHMPACRLVQRGDEAQGGPWPTMCCRLMIQNLRSSDIVVIPTQCLSLTMRDGMCSRPLPTMVGGAAKDQNVVDVTDQPQKPVRLAPLDVALLQDVAFPMQPHMRFEPDCLEACHMLTVTVDAFANSHKVQMKVPCRFVPEGTIWDHYELINRDFYIHHDGERTE